MSRFSALGDLLGAVFERGVRLVESTPDVSTGAALAVRCSELMSSRGEASGVQIAGEILAAYRALDADGRLAFFRGIARDLDPDPVLVGAAADSYREEQTPERLAALFAVTEPPRQELLRRLNMAPGGTEQLVAMRADLLNQLKQDPDLARIDMDFRHLLRSWFNRGFLVLRPIDWTTPAAILEKIIAYEAVHQIGSWDELRRRVEPPDRRCFAFFHPSMPDEPLIFVEVALTQDMASSIQTLLSPERNPVPPDVATTAVFYSISNCQAGLAGVSFGAFLIKQVARDLQAALPGLKTFVTLSPVPGFTRWLRAEAEADPDSEAAEIAALVVHPRWIEAEDAETARPRVLAMAARYFLDAKRPDKQPPDPVARFHLGNGAELAAIHWRGDVSEKGLEQAAGLMVNYLYRLERVEANHDAYAEMRRIQASRAVRALRRG